MGQNVVVPGYSGHLYYWFPCYFEAFSILILLANWFWPSGVVVYKPVQLPWLFNQNTTETSSIHFVLDVIFKCKSWRHLQNNSLSWVLDNTYLKTQKWKTKKNPHQQKYYKHSFYSFLPFNKKDLMPPKHFLKLSNWAQNSRAWWLFF